MWGSVFKDKRKQANSSRALALVRVSSCPARPSQTVSWFSVALSGLRSESLSSWACLDGFWCSIMFCVCCWSPESPRHVPILSAIPAFLFQDSRAW